MLTFLKLSRGMMRVYIVFAVLIFPIALWLAWGGVTAAEKYKERMATGINIIAVTTSYLLLHDGNTTTVNTGPMNTTMSTGWATYHCLVSSGRTYFVNEYNIANTHLSSKEYFSIINSSDFKKCLKNEILNAKIQVAKAEIFALILAISSIAALYILLLIIPSVVIWISAGFKNNRLKKQ